MRVAVVAGPEAGHAFPAIALCLRFLAAGDDPVLLTGREWLDTAGAAGVEAVELLGLDPEASDDDDDAGSKIHQRAARMAVLNKPVLQQLQPDLVVSDVITVCGGMAAEMLGVPWVELTPHPLYLPSKGLPPIGSGLAPGTGVGGRLRDTVMRPSACRPTIRVRVAASSPPCPPWKWTARTGRPRPSSWVRCTSSRRLPR
jgi:UDP:flavonoid glycosyltransferase YjiC (YdhE family)